MPLPALVGTYPHPAFPDATITAGAAHAVPWLQHYLSQPRRLVVDIETFGVDLDGYRIKCAVLGLPEAALVLDPRDMFQAVLIKQAIDYAEAVIMHKANFDAPSLVINGLMSPQTVDKAVCTMVMARQAIPGQTVKRDLDACATRYLGIPPGNPVTAMFKTLGLTKAEGFKRLDIDSPSYLMGAGADGIVTARLEPVLREAVIQTMISDHPFTDQGLDRAGAEWELERQQIENRWGIRRTIKGLRIDLDYLEQYRAVNGQAKADNGRVLSQHGIDPGNGNHLIKFLDGIGAVPPDHPMTPGGKPKADKDAVAGIPHPIARVFEEQKRLDKVEGYLEKCRAMSVMDGRIHPTTEVLAAAHGRSSMRGVEIHQFPAGARGIILPDEGDAGTSVDWSQQEPMLGINMAGDHQALTGYEAVGEKIYNGFAPQLSYKVKKVVILGGMYGEGIRKLSIDLGLDIGPWVQKIDFKTKRPVFDDETGEPVLIPSYAAGKSLQDEAFASIPRTKAMLGDLKRVAKRFGKVITMNGRVIPIPMGAGFDGGLPGRQTHKGPNYRICGSAADMKTDVIVEATRLGIADQIYFNMHDEFWVSHEIARDVQQIMERPTERLIRMAKRVPVIRTDLEFHGERWKGEEK
jgi:hypothetical protein